MFYFLKENVEFVTYLISEQISQLKSRPLDNIKTNRSLLGQIKWFYNSVCGKGLMWSSQVCAVKGIVVSKPDKLRKDD